MTTCSDLKLSIPRHKGAYLGIFASNRKPRSWQQTFPMVSDPSDLKHSSVCRSTNWTKSLYKSTATEWESWGKKPNWCILGTLQRCVLRTLQRCILGTGLFQIQRESSEARKLHIVRLRMPISNASWLYASNVSNELVFFQPSTNYLVYNRHSWI